MAPEDVGHLAPERDKGCAGEVEGGDDPVELGDLICVWSARVFRDCLSVLLMRYLKRVILLKSIAMKGRALATLKQKSVLLNVAYISAIVDGVGDSELTW